jgi:hypothetical protein
LRVLREFYTQAPAAAIGFSARSFYRRPMAKNELLTLRVAMDPKIHRDIEIAASASLFKFAQAIVRAYGFDFDHAFGFYSSLTGNYLRSPLQYELFADIGESEGRSRSVKKSSVAEAFAKDKAKMLFLFDYGDEWLFKVERLGSAAKEKGARYPRVVKSVGAAPEQYPAWED